MGILLPYLFGKFHSILSLRYSGKYEKPILKYSRSREIPRISTTIEYVKKPSEKNL